MKSFYKEISLSPFAGEEMIGSSHLLATAGTLRKYLQTPEVVQGKFNSQIENTRIVAQSGSRWYMSAEEIGLRLKHLIEEGVLSGIDTSTLGSVSVLLCDVFITVHTLSQMDYKNRMLYILLCICRGKAASMVAQSGMLDEGSELWKILNMKDVFNTVEKVLSDENTTISEEIVAQLFKFIDFITILPELNWSSWDQIPVHLENRWKGLDLEFPRNPYHFLLIVVRNLMSYAKDGWQLLVNKDINISRLSYRSQLKTHIMKINEVYHNHKDEDPTTLIRIHDEWYSFRDNYKICVKTDPVLGRTDKKVDTMYIYARSILTGTGARPMPLGVFLNGPAGVGKSFMSDLIIRALHEDMMPDTKYSQKLVCTRNSEKFMTNLTHLTRYIKLDDFNAMHSTSANPDPTILDILQIQNTTKVASVQAAVENKGQIYFNNLLTVATGNNALRGVDKVYKCVSAIGRRFHIVVQVEAIEGGGLRPIFAGRPELGLEQAVIYVGRFSNQPGKLGEVDFDKKNPLSIKEFIAYVRSEYAKYKDSSQTHTKLVSALEELDFDFNKMEAREPQYIAESAISPLILLPLWISFIGFILRIWYWLSPLWCRRTMINICTQQHFIMRVVVRYQLYKYFEVPLSYLIQEEARSQIQSFRPPRLAQILLICTTIFGILKMASQLGRTTNFAQGNTTSLPQKAWDTTKNSRDIVNKRIGNNPQVATRKKLSRNLLKFDVTSFDNSGNRIKCIRGICFLVKGRYALFPKHYLAGGNSFSLRWKRIDSTEKLVESGKIEFNLNYPQIHPDYDLASVKLNCQPGKDIEMHLPTQSAQRVQEAIEGKVAKLWTFNESKLVVLDGKPSTGISACNIPYKDVSGEHTFTNLVMCKHTFESYSGMCGSLIVIDNTIVGMHVAGAEGMSMGLFIVLGKDVVDALVPEAYVAHGNEFYELPFPDQWELSELHERSRYNFIHGGIARVHGTFKHHQSSVKSKLVRMPTAEKVESFTGFRFEKPIFKRQQTWESDPFRNNLLHVFGENPTIPRDIFNLAVEMYRNRIVKLSSEVKPLTLHQAINGIDGSKSIHRINMRTSTGYPYFTPKKEMLIPVYVDGKSTDDWALPNTLQVQYDVILDQYKKGCTVSPIFKGSLKDEATAAEKVREGKLRLFSCAPMAWCLVVRQYFLPLIELLRDTEESEMAVGINHRSSRWGTYAKQLTRFGPTRIVAGDYSKYDKYMDSLDIEVGLGVLIDFAKECGYDNNSIIIMKSCITDISLPCLMVNNDLCTVQGTNPSGQPITVELNCILNSIYMRCVWVKLSREHSTDLKFDDHVSLITYGDDNVMSCSWDNFNNYSVQKVLRDWGIKYTSPDKKEFEAPYYNIEEVEFLKRKFRLENIEGEAIWVAPLSFKSIYKPLIWTMGDLCIESHIKDMILCAFDELCIHPPGEWDHHGSFLMKLFQAYACNYDFHEFKISRENLLVKLYGELPEASFEDQQPDKDVNNNVNKEFNEECHRRMTHSMQGTEIPYSSGKLNFPTPNEGLGVETKPIQFLAQSEEIDPTEDSSTNEVQGVVTFTDGGPVVGPSLEDERNVARLKGHENASLSNFLSRPVIVNQATWTHGSGVSLDLDVYNLLLTNPAINRKIANFGLFRADLVIRMQVNATNFHYGALQVYWEPLPTLRVRQLAESLQSVSQRPLQFVLNPSDSKTLEFKIPFVYHKDYIVLGQYPGSEQIGALKTLNWRNLGTSNGVVSNATITTQAYFENVDMVIPTAQGEVVYEAQGKQKRSRKNKSSDKDDSLDKPVEEEIDEIREEETKEEGLITSISSATASALGMFRDIPVIGRFAMQGKNFMEKVSKTAHLWGLSRPHQQHAIKYVRPSAASRMAHSKGVDTAPVLALDPQCAAPLAGGCFAPDSEDQMALSTIFTRWSAFTSFDWDPADTIDTKLMDIAVYPGIFTSPGSTIYPSSVGYASMPFKYWRGSLEYKFVVVKSAYHSGRLRIQFTPTGTGLSAAAQSEVYTQILDISEGSETVLRVNWAQSKKYQELSIPFGSEVYNPLSIIYNTMAFNGAINVTVHNELVSPDGTSGVTIIAYVRGGPDLDFQVLKEGSDSISTLTYFAQGEVIELVGELDEEMTDIAAPLNFGERITSVRDLVKRYSFHRLFVAEDGAAAPFGFIKYKFGVLPAPGGRLLPPIDVPYNRAGPAAVNYSNMPLMCFFIPGYLGWRGSIRYKMDLEQISTVGTTSGTLTAVRNVLGAAPASEQDLVSTYSYVDKEFDAFLAIAGNDIRNSGTEGMELAKTGINGVLEYAIPWYNTYNFCVSNTSDWSKWTNPLTTPDMHHTVFATRLSSNDSQYRPAQLFTYVAAGEDFNLIWYLGAPPMEAATYPPP